VTDDDPIALAASLESLAPLGSIPAESFFMRWPEMLAGENSGIGMRGNR